MSNLIERLRDPSGTRKALRYEAADEIERLRNELSAFTSACKFYRGSIDKLQAVVDAAKVVQLAMDGGEVDCPFCAYDGLQEALAALEDEYTIKIKGIPSKLEPPEDEK